MAIPSEITQLVQRVNQELDQIEQDATEGLTLARVILTRIPNNFLVIQLLAFLNTSLFYVETIRRRLEERVEYLSRKDVITDEKLQEVGEDAAMELGRLLETKIRVRSIKNRLENLQ
ncbi:MAG: hypothetical protein ACRCT1_05285 [Microcoleaceae cyanobacterium]|jgi:hypothetical protein